MKPLHIALALLLLAALFAYLIQDSWQAWPYVEYSEPTIIERNY